MEEIGRYSNQHENANANETTTTTTTNANAYANATIIATVKHTTTDKLYIYVKNI